jgi:hypothetical protein
MFLITLSEAVIAIQTSGIYRLQLANVIEANGWQSTRRHWFRGPLGLFNWRVHAK